jgi:hypothetical protein
VILSVDLALPWGLTLNELISNAFKHDFPQGAGGEIKLTVRSEPEGKCTLCVKDTVVRLPADLDVIASKTLGLKLVRSLVERAKRTEHDGFILKPFHRQELKPTIDVANAPLCYEIATEETAVGTPKPAAVLRDKVVTVRLKRCSNH